MRRWRRRGDRRRDRDFVAISLEVDLDLAGDRVVGPIAVALFFEAGSSARPWWGPMVDLALEGLLRGGSRG